MAQDKNKDPSPDIIPLMDSPKDIEFKDRLKAINQDHKNALKQLKADKAEYFARQDMEKWKKLTELKAQFAETLGRNNVSGWNLKKLSTMADYYSYQHPKTPQLKANSDKEDWVKKFISSGGKIETLIEAAEKTQLATWNRLSGKTKRDKAKAKAQKEAEKKRKAKEAAEAAKKKRAGVKAKSSTSNASRLGL